jgi:PAS domain S-box-containing protein
VARALTRIASADGKSFYAVAIIQDITPRKAMETALALSEAKYRSLFDNAEVGIFRSRLDGGGFLAVNQRMAEILGYTKEELLGTPATIHWADLKTRAEMIRLLRERGELHDYQLEIVAKGGEVRTVMTSIRLDADGGYLEGTSRDITEQRQTDEALRRQTEELRTRHQERVRFNRVVVGRELRMVEQKQEINELCRRLGEPPRHAIVSPPPGHIPGPGAASLEPAQGNVP